MDPNNKTSKKLLIGFQKHKKQYNKSQTTKRNKLKESICKILDEELNELINPTLTHKSINYNIKQNHICNICNKTFNNPLLFGKHSHNQEEINNSKNKRNLNNDLKSPSLSLKVDDIKSDSDTSDLVSPKQIEANSEPIPKNSNLKLLSNGIKESNLKNIKEEKKLKIKDDDNDNSRVLEELNLTHSLKNLYQDTKPKKKKIKKKKI